jgi:hypothetical protein
MTQREGTVARPLARLRSVAYTAITVAAVAGVSLWGTGITYLPLRWGVVSIVVALAAVITLGRVPGPLGPVTPDMTARLLRGAGLVIVAALTFSFIPHLRERENPVEEARYAVPIIGSALVCYLVGFVAVTADRSVATGRTLRLGAASGVGAALIWLVAVVAFGQVPADIGLAFLVLVVAVALAIYTTAKEPAQAWIAALVAGTIGALLIVIELTVLASYAPARMIPDLAPAALTPADDLAQSRAELQDPFVLLFVVGAAIALTLGIISMFARTLPRAPEVAFGVGRSGD